MKLLINGETSEFNNSSQHLFIHELLEKLGHNPKLIVIELNGTILPPNSWPNKKLKNGDRLEIVTIVGGGSYN